MKKAQMEIMGLLVIVILIMLFIFFSFLFRTTSSPSEIATDFSNTQLISSFTPTMLETTTNCVFVRNNETISGLLNTCVSNPTRACNDDIGTACVALNKSIEDILNNTLKEWGISYSFNTSHSNNQITYLESGCNSSIRNFRLETLIQPTSGGNVRLDLKVC